MLLHGIKSCQTKGKTLIAVHEIKWSCVLIAESIKWLNLSPLPKQPGLEFLWKQQQQRNCRSKGLVAVVCLEALVHLDVVQNMQQALNVK